VPDRITMGLLRQSEAELLTQSVAQAKEALAKVDNPPHVPVKDIPVLITDCDNGACTWFEQACSASGARYDLPSGLFGDPSWRPAYTLNGEVFNASPTAPLEAWIRQIGSTADLGPIYEVVTAQPLPATEDPVVFSINSVGGFALYSNVNPLGSPTQGYLDNGDGTGVLVKLTEPGWYVAQATLYCIGDTYPSGGNLNFANHIEFGDVDYAVYRDVNTDWQAANIPWDTYISIKLVTLINVPESTPKNVKCFVSNNTTSVSSFGGQQSFTNVYTLTGQVYKLTAPSVVNLDGLVADTTPISGGSSLNSVLINAGGILKSSDAAQISPDAGFLVNDQDSGFEIGFGVCVG
jgi:hypothetical protein